MRRVLEGEGGPTTKTVKDIVSLYHLYYHKDEYEVAEVKPKKSLKHQKKRQRGVLSSKRDPNLPNRWPAALPLCSHNIFWLKTHSTPCICLGLCPYSLQRPGDGLLRVLPISTVSAQFEIVVNFAMVEQITADHIKRCDARKGDFVSAMIRFSEWELLERGEECRWYLYPDFIINLLMSPATWSSWRNKVERVLRGRGDRRQAYFDSLVEDYRRLTQTDSRPFGCNLPWDDEAAIETASSDFSKSSDDESFDSFVDNGNATPLHQGKENGKEKSFREGDRRKVAKKVENSVKSEPQNDAAEPQKDPYSHKRSPFNLYWIDRSKLPCLFYDDLHKEDAETFRVLPICCSTYHCETYFRFNHHFTIVVDDVEIKLQMLQPLNETNIIYCDDERTREFGLALIDFAHWDTRRVYGNIDDALKNLRYQWPSYILNLVSRPREWSSWRSVAERRATKERWSKRQAYFLTMQEEYLCSSEAEENLVDSDESVTTVDDGTQGLQDSVDDLNPEKSSHPLSQVPSHP